MKTYRVTLRPEGPFGSALQSDTLWGQVCWAYRERHGEARLNDLLGENGCFAAFSSAFPAGYLPRPRLGMGRPDPKQAYHEFKRAKKETRLPAERLTALRRDLTPATLNRAVVSLLDADETDRSFPARRVVTRARLRNGIDRVTGRVRNGILFDSKEIFYGPDVRLDLYVVLPAPGRFGREELLACLDNIGRFGYGRNAGVGLGHFRVEEDGIEEEPEILRRPEGATRFVSLSHGFPAEGETLLAGATDTKFGRHGGTLATSGRPYKAPVIRYLPGSIFTARDDKPFGGRAHEDVSRHEGRHLDGGWMVRFFFVPGKDDDAI